MLRKLFSTNPDAGVLAARITLGTIMIPHGFQHALGLFGGYGFDGTLAWMTKTLGFPAPLAALATFHPTEARAELLRENQQQMITATADLADRALGAVMTDVKGVLAETPPPPGIRIELGGQYAGQQQAFRALLMVLALAAVQNKNVPKLTRGDRILGSSKLWLLMTAIAGTTFLGFQAFEFTSFVHEGLTIRTNLFGSSFFTLTGFHGAHVTAGVLWLLTLFAIDVKRGLQPKDALLVDISALYWHFVDVVWIAIFTLVYLIR